jgi:AcrR family transcriptional regulator
MTKKRAAGNKPRKPLSRERVLRAAIALADGTGMSSLSMRNLARELGVEAMSLYNHVANKSDLLDGMVDLVIGEIEAPSHNVDWKDAMRGRATSAHEVLQRHAWATQLIVSRVNTGPASLHYVEATLGCLRHAGFSFALADRAWNAIDSHIYGFTLQKLNFPFEVDEYAEVAGAYLPHISSEQYPHLRALTQLVSERKHTGLQDFTFGLELLLDGLERLRDAARA